MKMGLEYLDGRAYETSRLRRLVRRGIKVADVVDTTYHRSKLKATIDALGETGPHSAKTIGTAFHRSRLKATTESIVETCHHSSIVRWLTKEPESDAVVVDLTETKTVAPFISLIQYVVARGERTLRAPLTNRLFGRVMGPLLREPVRVTSAFLLGAVLARLTLTWSTAMPVVLFALFLPAITTLLSLRVT